MENEAMKEVSSDNSNEAGEALVITDNVLRMEGMRLCAGCMDIFVLDADFCPECERIERALETRRMWRLWLMGADSAPDQVFHRIPDRVQVGTVPYEEMGLSDGEHLAALIVGWAGGLVICGLLWFLGKHAIAYVLARGW